MTQVANIAGNITMDMVNQLELSDKIRTLNERFRFNENKLAERFDLNNYQAALTRVMQGENLALELETIRKEQTVLFQDHLQQLHTDFLKLSESEQNTIAPFKLSDWEETNQIFQDRMLQLESFENELRTSNADIYNLEQECAQRNETIDILENALKDTEDKALLKKRIQALQNEVLQYEAEIVAIKSLIAERANALYQTMTAVKPELIDQMHTLITEVTALSMGIEIADGELILKEEFKYSKKPNQLQPWPYHEKLLVNEYYLSLFSSYDLNCPRALDPLNRMETERILKGEIEYVLTGKTTEKESMNWITLELLALRLPTNLMALLSDTEKMRSISNYTLALPQPWRTVAFTAVLTAWATAESYLDVMALLQGEGLSLIKSPTEWHLDLEGLMNKKWHSDRKSVV